MARYIDLDTAIENIRNGDGTPTQKLFAECCLLCIPTADVAPRAEVAREIFEEIEKIIDKHHSECYEYEDGDECDTAITYLSYASVDIAELKKKYTEGEKNEDQSD